MGLGHFGGGAAAARWLAGQGAAVTVSDAADENALADSLPLLADVPIAAIHLGGHRAEDFEQADLVVVNPAVRPDSPWLHAARQSGARLCTELELFIENCPAKIIGVTGSNGKSTTAAMIASILEQNTLPSPFGRGAGGKGTPNGKHDALTLTLSQGERGQIAARRTFLGGNIGGSLLDDLPRITPDDWIVLEISSFQLWHVGGDFCRRSCADEGEDRRQESPPTRTHGHGVCRVHVAVVTGCTPNHLDWHGSFADYAAAKQRILTGQTPDDFAVLNTFDTEAASWLPLVRGRPIPLPQLDALPMLSVLGEHNRINAACAAAAARAIGCEEADIRHGLETFAGLPQRLERIAAIDGRRFYNDSTATTPESTIAACGRSTRRCGSWRAERAKDSISGRLPRKSSATPVGRRFSDRLATNCSNTSLPSTPNSPRVAVETMQEALEWCWRRSRPGDAIVLSPACASTDQFRNFRHRGRRFAELVHCLTVGGDSVADCERITRFIGTASRLLTTAH